MISAGSGCRACGDAPVRDGFTDARLAAASAGIEPPRASTEERKFFRFMLTFKLILPVLKLLLLATCVLYWSFLACLGWGPSANPRISGGSGQAGRPITFRIKSKSWY